MGTLICIIVIIGVLYAGVVTHKDKTDISE